MQDAAVECAMQKWTAGVCGRSRSDGPARHDKAVREVIDTSLALLSSCLHFHPRSRCLPPPARFSPCVIR